MNIQIVVHHVGEGEKMFGVEQNFVCVRLQGMAYSEAFFAASIHSRGDHNDFD